MLWLVGAKVRGAVDPLRKADGSLVGIGGLVGAPARRLLGCM